jgi:ABC transporter substrate binding protein
MRRRDFVTLLGSAAAWPLAARAQQPSTPVVGFLGATSPDVNANRLRVFRQGLKDTGYVEGENVTIEYRWAENQMDRLPVLAAELIQRPVAAAARAMELEIRLLNASTSREIDTAYATFVSERPDALFVDGDAFFNSRRVQLVHLATRHAVPAAYGGRDYPEIGGLMSYGTNVTDVFHQAGMYAGRILKGAKPADLPVVQSSKFELVINAQTARMLGLDVPPMLLARADEVIE